LQFNGIIDNNDPNENGGYGNANLVCEDIQRCQQNRRKIEKISANI